MNKLSKLFLGSNVFLSIVILGAFLLHPIAARANVYFNAYLCAGCTDAQMDALAVAKANILGGWNLRLYVYDLERTVPSRYYLVGKQNGVPYAMYMYGPYATIDDKNLILSLKNVYALNGHSLNFGGIKIQLNIPSPSSYNPDHTMHDDGYINAYDIVTVSAANYDIVTCLSDFLCSYNLLQGNPAVFSALVDFFQLLKNDVVNFADVPVVFNIVFHDGSQATYKYDPATRTWSTVPNTIYDSHHNLIHPITSGPHQFLGGNPHEYDGPNIGRLLQTTIVGDPYCAHLDWDGQHLNCFLVP